MIPFRLPNIALVLALWVAAPTVGGAGHNPFATPAGPLPVAAKSDAKAQGGTAESSKTNQEGKCGEGKCGGTGQEVKTQPAGKCGEGKCGAAMMGQDAKCGGQAQGPAPSGAK